MTTVRAFKDGSKSQHRHDNHKHYAALYSMLQLVRNYGVIITDVCDSVRVKHMSKIWRIT